MNRTSAGSYLSVRRGRRWSSVQVDRWPILDATEQQAATVRELAVAAACYCATHGRRGGLSLAGQVLWYVTVPTADLEDVLEALLALERDEHEPARTQAAP